MIQLEKNIKDLGGIVEKLKVRANKKHADNADMKTYLKAIEDYDKLVTRLQALEINDLKALQNRHDYEENKLLEVMEAEVLETFEDPAEGKKLLSRVAKKYDEVLKKDDKRSS